MQRVNSIYFTNTFILLIVHLVEPTIKSYSQNQHVTIDSGSENLILIWEFGGDDIDNITCQKQNRGVAVTINDDFSIRTDHTYKLLLNNVRPVDSGEYSCGVFSRWGVAQSSKIKVNITSKLFNAIS